MLAETAGKLFLIEGEYNDRSGWRIFEGGFKLYPDRTIIGRMTDPYLETAGAAIIIGELNEEEGRLKFEKTYEHYPVTPPIYGFKRREDGLWAGGFMMTEFGRVDKASFGSASCQIVERITGQGVYSGFDKIYWASNRERFPRQSYFESGAPELPGW